MGLPPHAEQLAKKWLAGDRKRVEGPGSALGRGVGDEEGGRAWLPTGPR